MQAALPTASGRRSCRAVEHTARTPGNAAGLTRSQPLDVAHGRLTEEPLVLPAELRRIVVADPVSSGRGVEVAGNEESPGLLQPQLLLELQRAHRGDRLEVVVQPGSTHSELSGETGDAERLVVALADQLDDPGDSVCA